MKQAVICAFFGKLRDRFCEYGAEVSIFEKLERISRVPFVEGVEIVSPYELESLDKVKQELQRLKLAVSAVNVNIKSAPEFVRGAFGSPDAAVRRKAVEFLKRGKEAAIALGTSRVTCCPLSDGYDYAFQSDYGLAWDRMVDCVREAAEYLPEITLSLEFKPFETRVRGLLTSTAKTILVCQAAGGKNLGITLDIGHAAFGGESPAEALMLVLKHGLPVYVHTNDNNGRWDWDLIAGACNFWEYLEFLFYLKETGYDGYITADVAPFREDPVEIFTLNAEITDRLWKWLDTIDRATLRGYLERQEFVPARRMLEGALFGSAAVLKS
jgi:xylose isomerase